MITARTIATGTVSHRAIVVHKSHGPSVLTFTMDCGPRMAGRRERPSSVRLTVRSYRADHRELVDRLKAGVTVRVGGLPTATTWSESSHPIEGMDSRVWASPAVVIDEDDAAGVIEILEGGE